MPIPIAMQAAIHLEFLSPRREDHSGFVFLGVRRSSCFGSHSLTSA